MAVVLKENFYIMYAIIPLPEGFVSDILANVAQILTDLGGYLTLIIGIILGAVIFEIIIGALRK